MNKYGETVADIEANVFDEMQKIHGQYLLNVLRDFSKILKSPDAKILSTSDFNNIPGRDNSEKIQYLLNVANKYNEVLNDKEYSPDSINQKCHNYNVANNGHLLLSKINDYMPTKLGVQISPYLLRSLEQ
jgi:hypothetical protein